MAALHPTSYFEEFPKPTTRIIHVMALERVRPDPFGEQIIDGAGFLPRSTNPADAGKVPDIYTGLPITIEAPGGGSTITVAANLGVKDPIWGPGGAFDHGAIADGDSHPLSDFFPNLPAAQLIYTFATSLAEELDWAACQKALNSQSVTYMPAAHYLWNRTLVGRGLSRRLIFGDGDATVVEVTSALDGSDPIHKNNVFDFVNLTAPVGSYLHDNRVRDLYIDCTAQNAGGIVGPDFGRNLCAIEFQNVDGAMAERVHVLKAFGNAIVSASISPAMEDGVRGATIRDCIFDQCVRGILPQYSITGSVVQLGAMFGGEMSGCQFWDCGGPELDWFNCDGTTIHYNYSNGISDTPFAASQLGAIGSFHSDFGLRRCHCNYNTFVNCGGIRFNGLMNPIFQNDMTPTPGPNGCSLIGNKVYGTGMHELGVVPIMPASGGTEGNANFFPMAVRITGGTAVVVRVNGDIRVGSGQAGDQYALPPGSTVQVNYSSAPTWRWFKAPNLFAAHYILTSGNTTGQPLGQCRDNMLSLNLSERSPVAGFQFYDTCTLNAPGNMVVDPGEWDSASAYGIDAFDSGQVAGTGSKENHFISWSFRDTRPTKVMFGAYRDNTNKNTDNVLEGSYVGALIAGQLKPWTTVTSETKFTFRGNHGPGCPQDAPSIASGSEMEFPKTSEIFHITGTALVVTWIAEGHEGRELTLILDAASHISNGSDNIFLPGTSQHQGRAHDSLKATCDGENWYVLPPAPVGYLTASAVYDPPTLLAGESVTTNVSVPGVAPGDTVLASFSTGFTNGVFMTAHVQGGDSVHCTFVNASGATQNPGSGTIHLDVFTH